MRPVLALLAGAGAVYGIARAAGRMRRVRGAASHTHRAHSAGNTAGLRPGIDVTSPPVQTGDPATDTAIRLAQATYAADKIQTP